MPSHYNHDSEVNLNYLINPMPDLRIGGQAQGGSRQPGTRPVKRLRTLSPAVTRPQKPGVAMAKAAAKVGRMAKTKHGLSGAGPAPRGGR